MTKVWDASSWSEVSKVMKHSQSVRTVIFSPDGKQLVSGSDDNMIKVWDASSRSEVPTKMKHSDTVRTMIFRPDGKQLVSGSVDKTIKVWDTSSWSEVPTNMMHPSPVLSVIFSPDGKHLVSGSFDGTIKVWNTLSWTEATTKKMLHPGPVESAVFSPAGVEIDAPAPPREVSFTHLSVIFSPDGKQLVSGSFDSTIKVWDTLSWTEVTTDMKHSGDVTSVIFSPDGKQLVSGSDDNMIKVWDASSWSEVPTDMKHSGGVTSVIFSPDGKHLVSGCGDNTIKVWDAASWSEIRTLTGHLGDVTSLSFSPDGKHLVSGSDDNTIRVWDGSRRRAMLPILAGSGPINTASVSRDETLIVSGNAKGLVQVWDALSGRAMTNLQGHEYPVQTVAISPVMKPIQEKNGESNLDSPERRHRIQQIASGSSDKTVRLWELELRNRRVLTTTETKLDFDSEQGVHRIAFSENGRWVAAGGSSGLVRIWDTSTHELLDSFDAHEEFVKSLEFTDRDATLVTSGWAAERGPTESRTWRIKDGKRTDSSGSELMSALPGNWHSGMAKLGNRVATGRSDGILFVSDFGPETKPILILAHPGRREKNDQGVEVVEDTEIQAVAFSPDGELLATAGADHSIQLWNPRTGERLAVLSEHTAAVNSLQFYRHKSRGECDPDERRLVSSGSDGTVRVWLVDEILAHAPLPVPIKHLDKLPEITAETSPAIPSVNAEIVPAPEPEP